MSKAWILFFMRRCQLQHLLASAAFFSLIAAGFIVRGQSTNGRPARAGDGVAEVHSIDISLTAGHNERGDPVNLELNVMKNEAGNQLYSPAILTPQGYRQEDVIDDKDGVLLQLHTSDGLVNRVTLTDRLGFELDFYSLNQFSAQPNSDGVYIIKPGEKPHSTWRFEDPDPQGSNGNQLLVTKVFEGVTSTFLYVWNGHFVYNNQVFWGWEMTVGESGKPLQVAGTYRRNDRVNGKMVETKVALTKNPDGTSSREVSKDGQVVESSSGIVAEEVTRSTDQLPLSTQTGTPDSAANRKTEYTYDDRHNKVMEKEWTGHWTYYAKYDLENNAIQRVEQYRNNPYTGEWPDNHNRMFETVYSDLTAKDDSKGKFTTSLETETLLGTVVRRHWLHLEIYGLVTPGENNFRKTIEADATNSTATQWDDPTNLKTITYSYDETDNTAGKWQNANFLTVRPNGLATMNRYYEDPNSGNRTEVAFDGHLATGPLSGSPYSATIDQGTKTTVVKDKLGAIISSITVDIASNLTIDSSQIAERNLFGRPITTQHLSGLPGSYTEQQNDDTANTNRYGMTTNRTMDALGRETKTVQYASSSPGQPPEVVTRYQYDAAGRQTAVLVGPDGPYTIPCVLDPFIMKQPIFSMGRLWSFIMRRTVSTTPS